MIGVFIFIRLYQGPEVELQAQEFIAKKWQHLDPQSDFCNMTMSRFVNLLIIIEQWL